jgi:hypothetical protein
MAPRKKPANASASSGDSVQDLLDEVISKSSDWWRKGLRTRPVASEPRLDALLDRRRNDWSAADENDLLERFNESHAKAAVDKLSDRDKVALASVSKVSLQLQGCTPLGIFNPLVGRESGEDKKRGRDEGDQTEDDHDFGHFGWPRTFSEKLETLLVFPDYWGEEGLDRLGATLDFIARYNTRSKAPWEVQGARCRVLLSFNKSPRSRTVGQRLKEVYESAKSHCTACECRVFYEYVTRFPSSGRRIRQDRQLKAEVGQITAADLKNLTAVLDDIDRKRGSLVTREIQHRMYKRHRGANGHPSGQRLVEFTTRCLLKYGQDRVLELRGDGSDGSESAETSEGAETYDSQSDDEAQEGEDDDQLPTPRRRRRPANQRQSDGLGSEPLESPEALLPESRSTELSVPGAAEGTGHAGPASTTGGTRASPSTDRRSGQSATRRLSQTEDNAFESPPQRPENLRRPSSEARDSDDDIDMGEGGFDGGYVDDGDFGVEDMDDACDIDMALNEPSPTPPPPRPTMRLPPMRAVRAHINKEEGEGEDEGDEMDLFNAV